MAQATALSLPKTRFGRIDGLYTQCQSRHNEDEPRRTHVIDLHQLHLIAGDGHSGAVPQSMPVPTKRRTGVESRCA